MADDNIVTILQNGVQAMSDLQTTQSKTVPTDTSGQLSADAVVVKGFARVLGVSVIDGSAVGFLHDASTVVDAAAGNQIYVISTTKGFYPVNIPFVNGVVFKLGTANKIAVFYSRT